MHRQTWYRSSRLIRLALSGPGHRPVHAWPQNPIHSISVNTSMLCSGAVHHLCSGPLEKVASVTVLGAVHRWYGRNCARKGESQGRAEMCSDTERGRGKGGTINCSSMEALATTQNAQSLHVKPIWPTASWWLNDPAGNIDTCSRKVS